jgi:hypothetical protein
MHLVDGVSYRLYSLLVSDDATGSRKSSSNHFNSGGVAVEKVLVNDESTTLTISATDSRLISQR